MAGSATTMNTAATKAKLATKVYPEVTEPRCFPGPAQRAEGYLSCFQFPGWCPSVMDHGLLWSSRGTTSAEKTKKKTQETSLGREGGCRAHQKSQLRLRNPFLLFLRGHLCVGLPH